MTQKVKTSLIIAACFFGIMFASFIGSQASDYLTSSRRANPNGAEKLNQMVSDLDEIKISVDEIESKINDIDSIKSEVTDIKNSVDSMERKVNNIESDVSAIQLKIGY